MTYTLVSNGDVPDETYFNTLMKQGVIVCTSGTRPSSPNEGMTVYETDTDRYSAYTGAAWVTMGQTIVGTMTPTVHGSVTDPTLGTGGSTQGRYTLFNGKWCTFRGTTLFGTSGVNAGSGQYNWDIPFTPTTNITQGVSNVGSIIVRDNSGPSLGAGSCYIAAGASTMSMYVIMGVGSNTITATAPVTWAANDYFSWTITYEIS